MDDDDSGVFTAGAIVTVTVNLRRRTMGEVYEHNLQEGELSKADGGQEKEEEPAAAAVVSVGLMLLYLSRYLWIPLINSEVWGCYARWR